MPHVREMRKLLVSLDIGQYSVLEIFAIKTKIVSDIRKKSLNDIFTEFEGTSRIKNITDKLNLGELQVDDILAKFTAESAKKYISIR